MPVPFRSKMKVEMRLCSPLGKKKTTVNGLDELFEPSLYPPKKQILIAICSPWIDASALEKISDLCKGCDEKSVNFYILTFRAHTDWHETTMIKAFRKIRSEPFTDSFTIGRLPAESNSKGFRADILHAKIYAVAHGRQYVSDTSGTVEEAFFGSANFTNAGIGNTGEGSSRKFEIVARVANDDTAGKESVMKAFSKLWYICDGQQLGSVGSVDVFFRKYQVKKAPKEG